MYEAHDRIFGSDGAPSSVSYTVGSYSRDDELASYSDDDNGTNKTLLMCVPTLTLTFERVFAEISSPFVIYAVQPALPYLKTLETSLVWLSEPKCYHEVQCRVAAKAEALERVLVVEETAAVSLSACTLEKTSMVGESDEGPPR